MPDDDGMTIKPEFVPDDDQCKSAPTTIYLDEAGFSGNHLSDPESPYFVFASVKMSPDQAGAIVDRVIRDFRIQGGELKGKNLTKTPNGRKAVERVLATCLPFSKVVVFEKQFSLACKLFEYVFEPVISDASSLFYDIGFHKVLANLLYVEMIASRGGHPKSVMLDFEKMMRTKDSSGLKSLFGGGDTETQGKAVNGDRQRLADQIVRFALAHRQVILDELRNIQQCGAPGDWVLDLSDTAVNALLCHWGELSESLDVFCDKSKPLQASPSLFDAMVGRTDKVYVELNGKRCLLTYNMARPLQFVDSRQQTGVQLADVLASALLYAMRNRASDSTCMKWLQMYDSAGAIHADSCMPDPDLLDLERPDGVVNYTILLELMRRTDAGEDILREMGDFIAIARNNAAAYLAGTL
jgi:hypothetical protein